MIPNSSLMNLPVGGGSFRSDGAHDGFDFDDLVLRSF
jgi:hypothetical protein